LKQKDGLLTLKDAYAHLSQRVSTSVDKELGHHQDPALDKSGQGDEIVLGIQEVKDAAQR
jgi:hypothetical protein